MSCRSALKNVLWLAVAAVTGFIALAGQPAQAQVADYWKSAAIIGGSTAAGAYIGHKVAGPLGAAMGAGMGGAVGYAIDARRRRNAAYNDAYANGDPNGAYGPGAPYGQQYPQGGYNGPYSPAGYPGPYGGNTGPYGPNGGYNGPSGLQGGYGALYPSPYGLQRSTAGRSSAKLFMSRH